MARKILFIEDEFHAIKEFGEMLELNGDQIEVAANGSEGLERLNADNYDLIVMDVMMPHGSELPESVPSMATGLNLLRMIRQQKTKQDSQTPVVILTATSDSQILKEIQHDLEPGVFLNKPVSLETFLSSVDCALLTHPEKTIKAGWSEDAYQKEMVMRFSDALAEVKSSPRTASIQASLRVLAVAMDCEVSAILIQSDYGLRVSHVYTMELSQMDQWSGRIFKIEGLLSEVFQLRSYRSINQDMAKIDPQLARMQVTSALSVPFLSFTGKPSQLVLCNRKPFAKYEARFVSYDGELCQIFAEHLFGRNGAVFASTEEEFRTRVGEASRDLENRYGSLWQGNTKANVNIDY